MRTCPHPQSSTHPPAQIDIQAVDEHVLHFGKGEKSSAEEKDSENK